MRSVEESPKPFRKPSKLLRRRVPPPPTGFERLKWLAPGLLWMSSSVGSGSVLFTPRVGARYEYAFIWLALIVVFFMWIMIREAGRYSVYSGETLLEGYARLPGPRNWAVWFIYVPQIAAAIAGVAGLGALVGSAVGAAASGNQSLYASIAVAATASLVAGGRYRRVELICQVMAMALLGIALVAAFKVFDSPSEAATGVVPSKPEDFDLYFVLPWVGTILAGSMGIVWFSYWTATRGYGGGVPGLEEPEHPPHGERPEPEEESPQPQDEDERRERLDSWMRTLSLTAGLGVITGLIVLAAFLVLGSELLAPKGEVPKGADVANDLTSLFSEVWGRVGFWMLLIAIMIALVGSMLANQDGWGRSFADMSLILLRQNGNKREHEPRQHGSDRHWFEKINAKLPINLTKRKTLKNSYVLLLTGVLPVAVIWIFKDPVKIMSVSGIVAAAHTPMIAILTLVLNRRRLPEGARPGISSTLAMSVAGLFYLAFAALYFLHIAGINVMGSSSTTG